MFLTLCGILQILVVEPYFKIFSVDGRVYKDVKPLLLMFFLLFAVFAAFNLEQLTIEPLMDMPLYPIWLQVVMGLCALTWFTLQHFLLKSNKLDFINDVVEKTYIKMLEKNSKKETKKELLEEE